MHVLREDVMPDDALVLYVTHSDARSDLSSDSIQELGYKSPVDDGRYKSIRFRFEAEILPHDPSRTHERRSSPTVNTKPPVTRASDAAGIASKIT